MKSVEDVTNEKSSDKTSSDDSSSNYSDHSQSISPDQKKEEQLPIN